MKKFFLIVCVLFSSFCNAQTVLSFPTMQCTGVGFNLFLQDENGLFVNGNMDGMGIKGMFSSNQTALQVIGWFEPKPSVASETAISIQISRTTGDVGGEITVRYTNGQLTKKVFSGKCLPSSAKPVF